MSHGRGAVLSRRGWACRTQFGRGPRCTLDNTGIDTLSTPSPATPSTLAVLRFHVRWRHAPGIELARRLATRTMSPNRCWSHRRSWRGRARSWREGGRGHVCTRVSPRLRCFLARFQPRSPADPRPPRGRSGGPARPSRAFRASGRSVRLAERSVGTFFAI